MLYKAGMKNKMEHLNAAFEFKREPDKDGVFEGYASVFGIVDQGMDVVERGAFTKTLGGGRKVKLLWQHNTDKVIGVWDEIKEDERGLFVKGRILKDVQQGAEAMALMRAGAIDSMSIGYRTIEATFEGEGNVRKLHELELFEISLVTFPMLPEAQITDIKSIDNVRDFETFLRDAGMSRKEAAAVTLHGFNGLNSQRDAVAARVNAEGVDALKSQLVRLQENFDVGNRYERPKQSG